MKLISSLYLALTICSTSLLADERSEAMEFAMSVKVDIGESDTLDALIKNIETNSHVSVTCIGADASDGYAIASKMREFGTTNFLQLKGEVKPHPEIQNVTRVVILSKNVTKRLRAQVWGYNHCMWKHLQKKKVDNNSQQTIPDTPSAK